ncbi:hypothetical protein [Aquimarina macrocephali]|uniref:hypothetical protein n=1 Tax=Aquimarina macrocephali TaxID=666563 RepID=UPI003F67B1E0
MNITIISKSVILVIVLITIIILVNGCTNKKEEVVKNNPILGSWSIEEVQWITKDTIYSIKQPLPGIFMVTPKRYSIIWTATDTSRKPFKNLSHPTEEEMISGFRTIVFNSGTYTATDSTFNVQAIIAKVPGFEGGKQSFIYDLKGGLLKLKMIDETYPDGQKPSWFGKLETQFVMKRIDK